MLDDRYQRHNDSPPSRTRSFKLTPPQPNLIQFGPGHFLTFEIFYKFILQLRMNHCDTSPDTRIDIQEIFPSPFL